jgi:hypothetical protein
MARSCLSPVSLPALFQPDGEELPAPGVPLPALACARGPITSPPLARWRGAACQGPITCLPPAQLRGDACAWGPITCPPPA